MLLSCLILLLLINVAKISGQLENCKAPSSSSSDELNKSIDDKQSSPVHSTIYRHDYRPADFVIPETYLHFKLDEDETEVFSSILIRRNINDINSNKSDNDGLTGLADLKLDGSDHIRFVSGYLIKTHNENPEDISQIGCLDSLTNRLVIPSKYLPTDVEPFRLNITVVHSPRKNTQLFGLYKAEDILITQNEANGFRRITYFLDRPDVFSVFTTKVEGDRGKYPILLSNGNLVKTDDENNTTTHSVTYLDPHPKPCYLFALVAGKLDRVSSNFTVGRRCFEALAEFYGYASADEARKHDRRLGPFCRSYPDGDKTTRQIRISIWGPSGLTDRLKWALDSVKKSMLWDEIRYGRFYDLNEFHVVTARDFNAGAMENKGLNIFNNALVMADKSISTDSQFLRVQDVIGHEYFHNWSGDRVSVRDWFQLTLKEGFTVLREQQFSADINVDPLLTTINSSGASTGRLQDIAFMEDVQFAEDASALRHAVRPDSFISVENFYTTTVYEKGAEIVRMYQTILGRKKFREGVDRFFNLNDGRGATCEDFKSALESVSGKDLSNFFRWFNTSGTPVVKVTGRIWDPDAHTYTITLRQSLHDLSESAPPLVIPIRVGLISSKKPEDHTLLGPESILLLNVREGRFIFHNITDKPIPSLLRDFSAPVRLESFLDKDEILKLAAYDTDSYVRWKSAQHIISHSIVDEVKNSENKDNSFQDTKFVFNSIVNQLKNQPKSQRDLLSMMISLPSLMSMTKFITPFDPPSVQKSITKIRQKLVDVYGSDLLKVYMNLREESMKDKVYQIVPNQVARRRLSNSILNLLSVDETNQNVKEIVANILKTSEIENDRAAALRIIAGWESSDEKIHLINWYYDQNPNDDLLVDRWLSVQAASYSEDTYDRIRFLMGFPLYKDSKTPNRLRALIKTFSSNLVHFHHPSGRGYSLVANESLRWDAFNPKLGAGLATSFTKLSTLPLKNQKMIRNELYQIQSVNSISPNLREIVNKALSSFDHSIKMSNSNTDEL